MQTNCPQCAKLLTIDDALAGKRVRCPRCERSFVVGGEPKPIAEDAATQLATSDGRSWLSIVLWAFALVSIVVGLAMSENAGRAEKVVVEVRDPNVYFLRGCWVAWCLAVLAMLESIRAAIAKRGSN